MSDATFSKQNLMREILPGQLWLGNTGDASDYSSIYESGIVAIIDLALENMPPALARSLVYCRFPIIDGGQGSQEVLQTAIETVISLFRKEMPTLVVCGAGMSRSPAVVAAALSIINGENPDDWLRHVVSGHPHDISPQLWKDVRNVCENLKGLLAAKAKGS